MAGRSSKPVPEAVAATLASQLVDKSATDETIQIVLGELSCVASEAFGVTAAKIAEVIRTQGGIEVIVGCLVGPSAEETLQYALSLLGNLLTDCFDPEARSSLQRFTAAGGLQHLVQLLTADSPLNLFAAAALLNATSLDPHGCCTQLRSMGTDRLVSGMIATSSDDQLTSYASGVLSNLRA